jgi:hypothetical protein
MTKKKSKSSKKRQPARVLIECSPHRTTGGTFIPGLSVTDIEHESYIERHTVATLLLCHDVRSIASQGEKEPYVFDGKSCHHIPDFVVDTFCDALRIEVKAVAWLLHDKSLDKYVAVAKGYAERGVPFAFLVDAQLEVAPRFDSVKLLARYASSKVPDAVLATASAALLGGPMTIRDLIAQTSLQLVDILTMVARRHLCFDWSKPLHTENTAVSLPNQPFQGLRLEDILVSTRFGRVLAELALGRRPTDQRVMADAATWRQPDRQVGPFCFVGGFKAGAPLRDLGKGESIPRTPRGKRDYAPGVRILSNDRSV